MRGLRRKAWISRVLPSAHDVIAMRFRSRLHVRALQRLIEFVELSVSTNDRTHVVIEIAGLNVFDFRPLVDHARRAAPWLRVLQRFGRVEIVNGQARDRAAVRLDRSLLPNFIYQAYHSSGRGPVLAWVEGREAHAR